MAAQIFGAEKKRNLSACPQISGGVFLRTCKYISHIVTIQDYHIEQACDCGKLSNFCHNIKLSDHNCSPKRQREIPMPVPQRCLCTRMIMQA